MSQKTWTVLDLIRWTTDHFASKGIETARLDAECLLAHALETDRLRLYIDYEKPVLEGERAAFRELVKRRGDERVPVAQLTGRREFWSLTFEVTPDVLIPRPETETLIEAALQLFPDVEAPIRVLDLCTGSGAIALALAKERPKARITATDVSAAALEVAKRNAERLGLSERVAWLEGDAFEPVVGERFDLIVSNPPYVAESERASLAPELAHEPEGALFAGADGTDFLRRIAADVASHLEAGAPLLLEIGSGQEDRVAPWLEAAGLEEVAVLRDLAGRPRALRARARGLR
ncbi:MAG: peptide chain release factor N(5)-glutamine methyltransferase [Myxococcota bacterium]|nr:peptide chain release factor N(5)-glutamine methyltransferase [Myxococcota bacterium]